MWEREKVKAGKENEMRGWSRRREREFEQKTQRYSSRKKTGADWRNYKECVKRFLTLIFSLPNSLWATGKQV